MLKTRFGAEKLENLILNDDTTLHGGTLNCKRGEVNCARYVAQGGRSPSTIGIIRTMKSVFNRGLRRDLAAIAAGALAWACHGHVRSCAAEHSPTERPASESALVVAAEPILLKQTSVPVGSVLIAEVSPARSVGTSMTVRSLRGQSFEVPPIKVVSLRVHDTAADSGGRQGAAADKEIPPLIRRQPQVVQDAWRQIAAAIDENQGLSRPRPEPLFARAELWMMVGNYDAALRDLLVAMRIASDTGAAPRVYDAVFNRLRDVLERYDSTPVPPEDGEPSRHYGHGMHSFWKGHYVEAHKAFSNAISLAPGNPLYWYMRAVTHRRLGNEEAAQHDALLGASAERKACLRRDSASLDINRELRRLQGNDRIWLETQRRGDPSRRTMSGLQR
jgi:tetratricopeptide (TPR) repeat protein